jgi:hypothetical protein
MAYSLLNTLAGPFPTIYHAVSAAVTPVLALVLSVINAGLGAFPNRFTATLPVLMAVLHTVGRVLPSVTTPILPCINTLVHPKAIDDGRLRKHVPGSCEDD